MKEINISNILIRKRREKKLTQEDVANYMGVSKASVSKWETGGSYPDIEFLPKLATFYNISLDELLGYNPNLTKEEIRKIYHSLAEDFAKNDFNTVFNKCDEIIKEYYSCFPLLLQMVLLLINHYTLAGSEEKSQKVINTILELLKRIKSECEDISIVKQSVILEANIYLMTGKPEQVIELLGEDIVPTANSDSLISRAYELMGNYDKAKEITQITVFQNLMDLVGNMLVYLSLNNDNKEVFEETLERLERLNEAYHINRLNPNSMIQVYYAAAKLYMGFDDPDKAIKIIRKYKDVAVKDFFPCTLHGDDYFNMIDAWFKDFDLGENAPRSEKAIKDDLVNVIDMDSDFERLKEKKEFQNIVNELKINLGDN
ncbi:helix-turn-helix transcriptional regulator [uncultured Anaerofustis sp.]|uniref:helix-turn-helix domain-containing protein n=1 Tax=uncultured Anaerofustis sp. TaxID=904996 RepID=UPI0025F91121|nr:helix-turn-helix transcriptional regulator [uncultured Anaerofustis sp.]